MQNDVNLGIHDERRVQRDDVRMCQTTQIMGFGLRMFILESISFKNRYYFGYVSNFRKFKTFQSGLIAVWHDS